MTDDRPTEGTVTEELRQLGRNLTELLRTAWDSPERKAIQGEIANGINQLGDILKEESQKFTQSPAGQRVKDTAGDVRQRIRGRDEQLRQDLVNALHGANTRLRQTVENMSKGGVPNAGTSSQGETPAGTQTGGDPGSHETWTADPYAVGRHEVHPDDDNPTPRETGHQEIHPDDLD